MSAQVCVARIGAAHGVRGAVKLWTFTEDPFAVTRYGPLTTKDGARSFEVAHVREAKDHLVATFKGVTTREDAERLNGIELYVARDKLPETDEGEYYHADLIGLECISTAGEPLGACVAVENYGAGDVLEIKRPDADGKPGKTFMVPMRPEAVPEWGADAGGRIVIEAAWADQ